MPEVRVRLLEAILRSDKSVVVAVVAVVVPVVAVVAVVAHSYPCTEFCLDVRLFSRCIRCMRIELPEDRLTDIFRKDAGKRNKEVQKRLEPVAVVAGIVPAPHSLYYRGKTRDRRRVPVTGRSSQLAV